MAKDSKIYVPQDLLLPTLQLANHNFEGLRFSV